MFDLRGLIRITWTQKSSHRHAVFLAIQGGNAIEDQIAWGLLADGRILRVTLVHLTNSALGLTEFTTTFGA